MLLVWALLLLAPVLGWPAPETVNGTIPSDHGDGITLDPSLIRRASDNKLFLYNTGKNQVWTADSLYGPWTFQNTSQPAFQAGAPQLYRIDETYYLFSSFHFNYSSVGVTNPKAASKCCWSREEVRTSTTLEPDSWVLRNQLEIPWSTNYNILDASFIQAEGQNLLSFGSYQNGIYQIPLADPPIQLAPGANSSIAHLAMNQSYTPEPDKLYDPSEASFQFHYGDYYYLFFSSGECCSWGKWPDAGDVYKIMVCRSQDPRKGFVDQDGKDCVTENGGTMILGTHGSVYAPGGQGVMNDTEAGGPILYYHYSE